MKNILITGVSSYIGTSLHTWLEQHPDKYTMECISLRDEKWKERDFSNYDVVVHVAGIAHQKETKDNAGLYYKVNRDLAYDIAKKSKQENIKQFIFLSSMSVFGIEEGVIDEHTELRPTSHYGRSKQEAEKLITSLENEQFKVAILRPPMTYGKNCKGNYQRLAGLAKKIPIFPKIDNKRSMIYIDNLSEFIRLLIDDEDQGIFHPQNREYVCTSNLVNMIAEEHNKKMYMTKLFNPFIKLMKINTVKKVFGNLIYDKSISDLSTHYNVKSFIETIQATEKNGVD